MFPELVCSLYGAGAHAPHRRRVLSHHAAGVLGQRRGLGCADPRGALTARPPGQRPPACQWPQLAQVKSLTTVGAAPVTGSTPARIAELMTNVTHTTFISGMDAAFGVASAVALAGAVIALLTRRGHAVEGAAAI